MASRSPPTTAPRTREPESKIPAMSDTAMSDDEFKKKLDGLQERQLRPDLSGQESTLDSAPVNTPADSKEPPPDIKFPSCRVVLTTVSFFTFFCLYFMRVNLSVAIVDMVNSTFVLHVRSNGTRRRNPCRTQRRRRRQFDDVAGDFNWDEHLQGVVLAAFFYGYIVTLLAGGTMARRLGSKRLLVVGIVTSAILTIVTPVLVQLGDFSAIVVLRVLEGAAEGVTYPSMEIILSNWAPPVDKSRMVTIIYAGSQVGTILAMPVAGVLCHFFSWHIVCYTFGGLAVVCSVACLLLMYESPSVHPRIDPKERTYIEMTQQLYGTSKTKTLRVPWDEIFNSRPVYATAVAHFASNWGHYTLLTCLPTYFRYVLRFNILMNGLLCGLPFLFMWIVMILGGLLADYLRTNRILSTTSVRKIFNAVGFLGPAGCLIGVGYITCNSPATVALVTIAVGLSGLSMAGWAVNHHDLAPNFAGALMSFTNVVGTVPGLIVPSIVAAFTSGNQTNNAWRNVFFVIAGVYTFATIFFWIFGSGQRQLWSIHVELVEEKAAMSQEKGDKQDGARLPRLEEGTDYERQRP